jgi:membrane protease YdiL (CAAX protease family)
VTDESTTSAEEPPSAAPVFVTADDERAALAGEPTRKKRPPSEGVGLRWPWWLGLAVLFGAILAAIMEGVVVHAIATSQNVNDIDAWVDHYTQYVGLGQDGLWIFVAVFVPYLAVRSLRARDFGLVVPRPARGVLVFIAFAVGWIVIQTIYAYAIGAHKSDNTFMDKLSYQSGDAGLNDLAYAWLFVIVAPIAEELIFRAVLFRSLATGIGRSLGKWPGLILGMLISGALFGAAHAGGGQNKFIPLLIIFGCMLAIAYQLSQSLLVNVALHSTNNVVAVIGLGHSPTTWLLVALIAGPFLAILLARLLGVLVDHLPRRAEPPARHVPVVAPAES